MSTFTLRRFTNQETLKSIRTENLLSLLGQHKAYFARRGVALANTGPVLYAAEATGTYGGKAVPRSAPGAVDYEALAHVLMTPDESTPRELVDDLFFVDEMAIRTPPGLYATEARPIGFGLHMARPHRNLLLVTFGDRQTATGRVQ
jgi:hypothetical protein